jgi:hypothetical protein
MCPLRLPVFAAMCLCACGGAEHSSSSSQAVPLVDVEARFAAFVPPPAVAPHVVLNWDTEETETQAGRVMFGPAIITPPRDEWRSVAGMDGVDIQMMPLSELMPGCESVGRQSNLHVLVWLRNTSDREQRVPDPGQLASRLQGNNLCGLFQLLDAEGASLIERSQPAEEVNPGIALPPQSIRFFHVDVLNQKGCKMQPLKPGRYSVEFLGARASVSVSAEKPVKLPAPRYSDKSGLGLRVSEKSAAN